MNKTAAYEIALADHPLWVSKVAEVDPAAVAAGGAIGLGGAGYALHSSRQKALAEAAKKTRRMKVLGNLAAIGTLAVAGHKARSFPGNVKRLSNSLKIRREAAAAARKAEAAKKAQAAQQAARKQQEQYARAYAANKKSERSEKLRAVGFDNLQEKFNAGNLR